MSPGGTHNDRMEDGMARRTGATHQGIWRSLVFTSILRTLGLCAFISMLALPLKSYADIDPGQLGLDSVASFAVYANGSLTVNGPNVATINGDVGLGPNGTQNFAVNFTINGTYRVDHTANNSNPYNGANFTGGTASQDLHNVSTTVSNVSAYAAGLTPTASFGTINNGTTITGNGGYNIIDVDTISLSGVGGHKLTLKGGANDVFVLNVSNSASFFQTSWTPIVLNGGVTANHVLFNLLNTSATTNALYVTNDVILVGTFIAPSASIALFSDTIDGGVFAGGNALTLRSGSTITADVFEIPEPSSFALVGITCLFGLGLWSRRRQRR